MAELGKAIFGFGLLLVLIGAVFMLAARFGLPFGRLPGDFAFKSKHVTVFLPLGTSILLSLVLTAILYLLAHLRR